MCSVVLFISVCVCWVVVCLRPCSVVWLYVYVCSVVCVFVCMCVVACVVAVLYVYSAVYLCVV